MRRLAVLTAGAVLLAVATGCGPAGSLSPMPTVEQETPTPTAAPSAPAEPSPSPTATADPHATGPANLAPAGVAPPFPGLPVAQPPAFAEVRVDGAPLGAGGLVDVAVACVPRIDLAFGPAEGIASLEGAGHGMIACRTSGSILLRFGVPAEVAHLYRVHEADVPSPPVLRVASGEGFAADAAAQLAAAADVATVTVSVGCDGVFDITLAGETLSCSAASEQVVFSRPIAAASAITDLRLPPGASAYVFIDPVP